MKNIIILLCLFGTHLLYGQLGYSFYGGDGNDVIYQITPAGNDEYYLLGGKHIESMEIWLAKINAAGEILWEKTYGQNTRSNYFEIGYQLLVFNDSTFYITGQVRRKNFSTVWTILIKTDILGNKIWKREYEDVSAFFDLIPDDNHLLAGGYGILMRLDTSGNMISTMQQQVSSQTYIHKIIPTDDGNFLLAGRSNVIGAGYSGIFIRKITPSGDVLWTKIRDTATREYDFEHITELFESTMGVVQDDDGSIWLTNHTSALGIGLFQYDQGGNLLTEQRYGDTKMEEFPTSLLKLSDGSWLISGSTENDSIFALKIKREGRQEWLRFYGNENAASISMTSIETSNHLVLGGTYQSDIVSGSDFDASVFRMEKDGNAYPYTVRGYVLFDKNKNCQHDAEDSALTNWFITTADQGTPELLLTDAGGYFEFKTNAPSVLLKIINPDTALWTACIDTISVLFDTVHAIQTFYFFVGSNTECSALEVSLTQPDLVKCDTSCMTATVINRGNIASDESLLHINWDKDLNFVTAPWPYQTIEKGIEIDVPVLEAGEEIRVEVCLSLDCVVQLGATHQIEATIEPISCREPYLGPFLEVQGWCDGDEVKFRIQNTGEGGSKITTTYSVYINELLVSENMNIELSPGQESRIITFPADGRTWRIEVQQTPDVPFPDYPSASVEACGTWRTGLHDIGLRNAFRPNDYSQNKCLVLASNTTGAVNEVAEAFTGIGTYNIIMETGALEYTARVKNDFPFVIQEVIFDLNFMPTFETSSFQLVSSNAAASVSLIDNQNIRVTMTNLGLEPGQVAMARFRVRTAEGLLANTNDSFLRIQCRAYLDENGPVSLANGYHNYLLYDQAEYAGYGMYPDYMRVYGGRHYDFGSGVVKGDGEALLLVGSTNSFGLREYSSGYVIKTDLSGRVEWQAFVQPDALGSTHLYSVQPDGEGGCIVSGSFLPAADASNYNYTHFYYGVMGRIDANGKMVWIKLVRPVGAQYGTTFRGVVKTTDHHYVAFGTVDQGDFQRVYVKMDKDGNTIWTKQQTFYKLDPYEGVPLADGGALFVGDRLNTYAYPYPIVQRIDSTGKILWEKTISSGPDSYVLNITLTDEGGFMLAGSSGWEYEGENIYAPIFIKCDSAGNTLWIEKPILEGLGYLGITGVEKAKDGGYLATGYARRDSAIQDFDILLLKVDDEGKLLWYTWYGGKKDETPFDIESPSADAIYIFGHDQPEIILYDLQSFLIKTNGDGIITSSQTLETDKPETKALLFPNPAGEAVNVVLSPKAHGHIPWMVCDMMGRIFLSGEGPPDDFFQINTSRLSPGSYIVTFPGTTYPGQVLLIIR